MLAVIDYQEDWPFLWLLGTLSSREGKGPATGDPGIQLPAPDLAAWHLMAPPQVLSGMLSPAGSLML